MALSTKFMVQKYITIMILTEYCFKMVTTIIVDVTDEYDRILGLRQEARAKSLGRA